MALFHRAGTQDAPKTSPSPPSEGGINLVHPATCNIYPVQSISPLPTSVFGLPTSVFKIILYLNINSIPVKTILLITADNTLREEVTEALRPDGYEVIQAASGKTGLRYTIHHHPDLILCEIMMSGMDGYEVLARLRQHEQARLIPFIFISAPAGREDLRKVMEMGADDCITKPFTLTELKNAIAIRLEKYNNIRIGSVIENIERSGSRKDSWRIFQHKFVQVYPDLFGRITMQFPELTQLDLTIISAILFNLNSHQIAGMLNIAPESVRKSRYRLKKKLKLRNDESLVRFVHGFPEGRRGEGGAQGEGRRAQAEAEAESL